DAVLRTLLAFLHRSVSPIVLQACFRSIERNPLNEVGNRLLLRLVLRKVLVREKPSASLEDAGCWLGYRPVAVSMFDLTVHNVVNKPCRTEESEYRFRAGAGHIGIPGFLPVLRSIAVAVVRQLFGVIKKLFALRINMKLAVNNPAFVGAVLDWMPDVAV